ncbi:MAG TPA: hypothetical protein VHB50_03645 [Bryobacteraceae bacterium]|nr:hypothetical protein [Bryobacteraceae bacterium]
MSLVRFLLWFTAALSAHAQFAGSFYRFDVPNAAATYPRGINSAGAICGYYTTTLLGTQHAFVRNPAGVVTTFDAPGAAMTSAFGINDAGQVVGFWSPDINGNVEHAFLRDASGAMTTFDVPQRSITSAWGINNAGQMVLNALEEPGPNDALFRTADGAYTPIAISGVSGVYVYGLNNSGAVVGSLIAGGLQQAFLSEGFGTASVTSFIYPGSTTATVANGINDRNEVVGYYTVGYRGGSSSHAFLRYAGGNFAALDVPAARSTLAAGINNQREIVGVYDDPAGGQHGFLAIPEQHHPLERPVPRSRR